MGNCFVSMTVTISYKDRGGRYALSQYSQFPGDWTVTYNGVDYDIKGISTGFNDSYGISSGLGIWYAAIIDKNTGKVIRHENSSGDILVDAGETITLRFIGLIEVDPDSLNDSFDLNVKVPNSNRECVEFKYIIPANS